MGNISRRRIEWNHTLTGRNARMGLLLSCALSALWLPGQAGAQEGTTASDGIEDIVVTARRVEEKLQTTPVAVTAMTGQMLEDRGIKDVTELSGSTPNLVLQASGVKRRSNGTPDRRRRGTPLSDMMLVC